MNFFTILFMLIMPLMIFADEAPTYVSFEPKLVYSKNDELCKEVLLNHTKKYFKGSSLAPTTKSKLVYLKWDKLFTHRTEGVEKISLSFKDGKQATILKWDGLVNWRGTYSAFFYSVPFKQMNFQNNKSRLKKLKEEGKEIYPDASFSKDYNNSKFHLYSSQWRDMDIFRFDGKYFYENKRNQDLSVDQKYIGTLEILEDGTLRPTCVVQTKYKGKSPLLKKQNFAAFLDALNNIKGGYGYCGAMYSEGRILSLVGSITLEKITYRPWAKPSRYYNSKELSIIPAFIDEWGHRGLWNYDVYRRYLHVNNKAKQDFLNYYIKTFGVDKQTAQSYATSAYNQILSAYFSVPYYGLSPKQYDLLRKALLEGRSVEEIKPMLVGKWKGPKKNNYYTEIEPTLFYALRYPKLVQLLLDKGADINSTNAFGKTALMYAAQYNLYKTAKLLLKSGIDVNKQTVRANNTCYYAIGRQNVSALHYAVRYADNKFVKLLLDYGANKELKDSNGKTAFDWIELFKDENKQLSPAEIVKMQKLLKPMSDKERKVHAQKNIQLAQKAYAKKELKKASFYYEKALQYEPKNATAISDLALVYYKLGNYPLAAKMARYSAYYLKDSEKKAAGFYNMGLICTAANPDPCLMVEGSCECAQTPFYYFLQAHIKSPSAARAKKVIEMLFKNKTMELKQSYTLLESRDKKVKIIYLFLREYVFSKKPLDENVTLYSKYKNKLQNVSLKLIDTLQTGQTKYFVYSPKMGTVYLFKSDNVTDKKICYDKELKNCSELKILHAD